MRRFAVTVSDGTMRLYYRSREDASSAWPDAVSITEIADDEHMQYIDLVLKACKSRVCRDEEELCILDTAVGECRVKLLKDTDNNRYYDYIAYQMRDGGRYVFPSSYDIATPEIFVREVLQIRAMSFELISVARSWREEKLVKPRELRGVKQIASVSMLGGKTRHGIYILNDDLYIRCGDFFSPSFRKPEDIGTPLVYRLGKYFGVTKKDRFIYPDTWGDVVLRQSAWLKFANYIPTMRYFTDKKMSAACCDFMKNEYTGRDLDNEWRRFFENVAKEIRKARFDHECL